MQFHPHTTRGMTQRHAMVRVESECVWSVTIPTVQEVTLNQLEGGRWHQQIDIRHLSEVLSGIVLVTDGDALEQSDRHPDREAPVYDVKGSLNAKQVLQLRSQFRTK